MKNLKISLQNVLEEILRYEIYSLLPLNKTAQCNTKINSALIWLTLQNKTKKTNTNYI